MLKCKNASICVHPSEVCDSVLHCPLGDDEVVCVENKCLLGYKCIGLAVDCEHTEHTDIPQVSLHTRAIRVSQNHMKFKHNSFMAPLHLEKLVLSSNYIVDICTDDDQYYGFSNLALLIHLDLRTNTIVQILTACFHGLASLRELILQNNLIYLIQ